MRNTSAVVDPIDDFSPMTPAELEQLPVILRVADMVRIYRRNADTIRRELRQGIFRPLPFDTNPYRWRRVDVLDDVVRRPAESVRRRQHKKAS